MDIREVIAFFFSNVDAIAGEFIDDFARDEEGCRVIAQCVSAAICLNAKRAAGESVVLINRSNRLAISERMMAGAIAVARPMPEDLMASSSRS